MTTPERLRRRQLIEGTVLILLAIFTVLQGMYFSFQKQDTQACINDNFRDLSVALTVRSQLTARETSQNKKLWLIYAQAAGLVKDDPTQQLKPADQRRFQVKLVHQLLEYQDEIRAIEKERKENPLPPYPVGSCDKE